MPTTTQSPELSATEVPTPTAQQTAGGCNIVSLSAHARRDAWALGLVAWLGLRRRPHIGSYEIITFPQPVAYVTSPRI